jgi:hypothetical protein
LLLNCAGLLGVVSAILASFAAFGLCMYIGVDFIGINLAAPFLMLGIGIDDTFVILAAWRLTSVHDPVPLRMATAYREAAVSGMGTIIRRKKTKENTQKTNEDILSSLPFVYSTLTAGQT